MDRRNFPGDLAKTRESTARGAVDDFLHYRPRNLTRVLPENEENSIFLETGTRQTHQLDEDDEFYTRMTPDVAVTTASPDNYYRSVYDSVVTESGHKPSEIWHPGGNRFGLNSDITADALTPSTPDTTTDVMMHYYKRDVTDSYLSSWFTSAEKYAHASNDASYVTSQKRLTIQGYLPTRAPPPESSMSHNYTATRLMEILWSPSRPPDHQNKSMTFTMSERDDESLSRSTGVILPVIDNISQPTIASEYFPRNVTRFISHASFSSRDSTIQDPFHNATSTSSWYYGMNNNATFQDRASLSSGEPASFTFDLASFLTFTPPSTSDDGVIGAYDGEEEDVTSIVVLKVILLALISLVGSFGNVMVIWSVVKERGLHRPPFYFLLSLGVTDLSRAIFCVPVVITTVLHGSSWRHGESACKLFAFATSFFVFSSALSLLAISIDRHISIVYSKTYRRRSPGIANLVVAIVIWVIAFSVSFPPVVGVGDYVFIPDEAQCAYQQKHYTNNDSVSSALVFVAILFLTYLLYFRIFRFLRAHRRMRPLQHTPALSADWAFVGPGANGQAFINWLNGFGGQAPVRQGGQRSVQRLNFGRVVNLSTAKNEHLTRLFLVLTVVFGVAWLPYIVLSTWRIFFDASLVPSAFVTVSAWLGYGQVALCPVVYFMIRGPVKKPSRTVYSPAEKREFLLENKTAK